MQKIKAYIIDDEPQSRVFLIKLLQEFFPEITISGQAASVAEALQGIMMQQPEIVFLDIQLNGETGFDLLECLPSINFAIIFTTAFDKYAIKAIRFSAVDYLLKPIIKDELFEAVNKVKRMVANENYVSRKQVDQLHHYIKNPPKNYDKIAIPTSEGFLIIPVNEIVYCRADSNYTEFYLTDKKRILSSYTLKQYDEMLTSQSFFRAHRSYLINLAHIKMYRRGEGGEIVMSNDHEIELSRTHKDEFLRLLNIG